MAREELTDAQLHEMKEAFALFDSDSDGFITMQELCTVMKGLRQSATSAEISEMISHVDIDGNGLIDFNEFLILMGKQKLSMSREAETRALFNALDKDDSGYIDCQELKQTLESLNMSVNDREIQFMMDATENSIPGRIYYEEFESMMCGQIGRVHRKLSVNSMMDLPATVIEDCSLEENDESKELRVAFALCDKDGDGYISASEVYQVMKTLHVSTSFSEVLSMIDKNDLDGNGLIDFKEFCTLMKASNLKGCSSSFDDGISQAFKVFDRDKSGFVDSAEIEMTMRELGLPLTKKDVQAMMRLAGFGMNGQLYYEDFIKVMKSYLPLDDSLVSSRSYLEKVMHVNNAFKYKDMRKQCHLSLNEEKCSHAPFVSMGRNHYLKDNNMLSGYQILNKLPSNAAPLPLTGVNIAARPELQVAFALFDRNTDGRISFKELKSIIKMFYKHTNNQKVAKKFKKIDRNGDGFISFDEMVVMLENYHTEAFDLTAELHYLFNKFDRDGSGYIDSAELQGILVRYGIPASQPDVDRMLARAGVEPLGHVYFEDFVKMITNNVVGSMRAIDDLDPLHRHYFTDDELDGLLEAFHATVRNGSSVLSAEELRSLLSKHGCHISMEKILDKVNAINTSGDGTVDFHEFLKMMSQCKLKKSRQSLEEDEMRQAFKVFDIDGNGFIDAEELRVTMDNLGEKLTDEDVMSMITEADINGDGKIDYEEFIRMMANRK